MIKLSIIIPAYNVENYILQLVESLYNQIDTDYSNYEVIIVDDGSTDDTIRLIKDAKLDDRFQFSVYSQENYGCSVARNLGISKAKGLYYWFVDSDDLITNSAVADILWVIDHYDVDVIRMGNLLTGFLDENGIKNLPEIHFDKEKYYLTQSYKLFATPGKQLSHTRYVWRSSIIHNNNLKYPENISNNEDIFFMIKVICESETAYVNDTMTYYLYRDLQTSLSRVNDFSKSSKLINDSLYIFNKLQRYGLTHSSHWTSEKNSLFNELVDSLKFSVVSRVLYGHHTFLFNAFFIKLFKATGVLPIQSTLYKKSIRNKLYKSPLLLLLASSVLRINFLFRLFQKLFATNEPL